MKKQIFNIFFLDTLSMKRGLKVLEKKIFSLPRFTSNTIWILETFGDELASRAN